MLQIVEGMVYLHEQDIMHRDLKPKNCLVKARSEPPDVYYTLKLADFGSAREMDTECTSDLFTVNPGTILWMAPEMFGPCKGSYAKVEYTKSVDVYGFAIICYQVVTGEMTPMPEITGTNVMEAVRNGARPSFPASLSCPEALKQLIINCWHEEPGSRPTFVDIRKRLWTIRKDLEL
jgi:serine/threonine protein kinase